MGPQRNEDGLNGCRGIVNAMVFVVAAVALVVLCVM